MTTKQTGERVWLDSQFAARQGRQLVTVMLILSAVLTVATATYTWITWKSLAATREASELQRQLLELQRTRPTSKAASTRRSEARPVIQASTEAHGEKSRARPSAQHPSGSRQEVTDSQAVLAAESNSALPPRTWGTRSAMLERPGRQ